MKLDLSSRKAYIENKEITLQGKQFDMLEYLINYKDKFALSNSSLTLLYLPIKIK